MSIAKKVLTPSVLKKFFVALDITKDDVLSDTYYPATKTKDEMYNIILKGHIDDFKTIVINFYPNGDINSVLRKQSKNEAGKYVYETVGKLETLEEIQVAINSRTEFVKKVRVNIAEMVGIKA